MKNTFKTHPLTLEELNRWKENPLFNPRTKKSIKLNGKTYILIQTIYNKIKADPGVCLKVVPTDYVKADSTDYVKAESTDYVKAESTDYVKAETIHSKILNCRDNRDPISMNQFWIENAGIKTCAYPPDDFDQLVFYEDSNKLIRCLEKESLKYLKFYNINKHPVTLELLPVDIFNTIDNLDIQNEKESISVANFALDIFQYFTKLSIFIDYNLFLNLNKTALLKFNYELKDFWVQNFNEIQREDISNEQLFTKSDTQLQSYDQETVQLYLLNQMHHMLLCDKEEYKFLINYIILGALGIVIPTIKEQYPDFSFGFC